MARSHSETHSTICATARWVHTGVVALVLGLLTSGVLLVVAGVHVNWALGSHWPMTDTRELHERVTPPGMPDPGPVETSLVAATLAVAAALVAMSALGTATWLSWGATALVGVILALRGLGGLVISGLLRRQSTFARLDRRYFSPMCIALALGTAIALP